MTNTRVSVSTWSGFFAALFSIGLSLGCGLDSNPPNECCFQTQVQPLPPECDPDIGCVEPSQPPAPPTIPNRSFDSRFLLATGSWAADAWGSSCAWGSGGIYARSWSGNGEILFDLSNCTLNSTPARVAAGFGRYWFFLRYKTTRSSWDPSPCTTSCGVLHLYWIGATGEVLSLTTHQLARTEGQWVGGQFFTTKPEAATAFYLDISSTLGAGDDLYVDDVDITSYGL